MAEYTLEELVEALRECAGEDEEVDLGGDIHDQTFEDLGYDSLALFNTVSRIERELNISLPETIVGDALTPRQLLKEINESRPQVG
ncbi:acyl carrier protein [Dactylosporangium sp. CA-092794]|uniref:acyl carrier protein n=1 Tax=Dactylosporangium sp. CA-092794 TaxID=3239929 RepID=UPI003D8ACEEF